MPLPVAKMWDGEDVGGTGQAAAKAAGEVGQGQATRLAKG